MAPAELESLLHGIPGVSDAAVVGQPDLAAGELPIAFIVKQSNATLTEQQIMSHVNGESQAELYMSRTNHASWKRHLGLNCHFTQDNNPYSSHLSLLGLS